MSQANIDNSNFKAYIILGYLLTIFYWNAAAGILSLILLVILKYNEINAYCSLLLGLLILVLVLLLDIHLLHVHRNIEAFLFGVLDSNRMFFLLLTQFSAKLALYYLYKYDWLYCIGLSLPFASFMLIINDSLLPAHAKELSKIGKGQFKTHNNKDLKKIDQYLSKLDDRLYNGSLLGVSLRTKKEVVIPDKYINQIVLVLGTTGAGKTITLRRFYQRALFKNYPLIIVDGKPTKENVDYIHNLAKQHDRHFYSFNCFNNASYDPFSSGSYTEIKDKIITLKDKWESDYYKTVAEDYLQTTLEVLQKANRRITLKEIAACLDFDTLVDRVRLTNDERLAKKISALKHYQRESLTGFQAHLNLLINSELGEYLSYDKESFTLMEAIDRRAVVYFALPALKYSSFAAMLGKLIINDIKTTIEPLDSKIPIFITFDEFSIFAGEQVLNLVNMGRGKGLYTIFGTQGLADLEKISPQFESQLMNCVNTLICHRLNSQKCAERVSKWIGTQDSYDITAQISINSSQTTLGSASKNKAFLFHPDEIKQALKTGEIIYVTKVESFHIDTVKIKST